jgi:ADP-ribose pyrophosphatase
MPDGKEGKYYYADSRGSVMVVPQLDVDAYVLVRQYRYLNDKESLEFPGGGVISSLSIYENAAKELLEETGYKAATLAQLGTNEICTIFHANQLEFFAAQPDETEFIENVILTAAQIDEYIRTGELWDGMSITAWMLYKVHCSS